MAQITRNLTDPVKIGSITTKNRICIPPMVVFGLTGPEGLVTEKHLRHYGALAKGGAGLIIQEATCVLPTGKLSRDQLGIWSDEQIPGLKQIVETVHAENCPIFLQIHHAAVTDRVLSVPELEEIKTAFIQAGWRAFQAGYDGVELHGCHSYLLCQLLNRETNKTGVEPIGYIADIIAGIRQKTSPEFVIGIRLGGFEPTLQDGIAHGKALVERGIQFLDISYGYGSYMDKTAPGGEGLWDTVRAAAAIKREVDVPVFAVGGIRLPGDAEFALRETDVDMIDVGRSALVDPDWPNQALNGGVPGRCLNCKRCQWRIDVDGCPGRKLMQK